MEPVSKGRLDWMTRISLSASAVRARLAEKTAPPVPRSSFCRMSSTPAPAKERVNSSPQSPTTTKVRDGFKARTASRTSAAMGLPRTGWRALGVLDLKRELFPPARMRTTGFVFMTGG